MTNANVTPQANGTMGSSELGKNGQKPRLLLMGLKRYEFAGLLHTMHSLDECTYI
jgi:hypothetical protein